jgi:hypothetical protein
MGKTSDIRNIRQFGESFGRMEVVEMPGFAVEMVGNVVYPYRN